MSPRGLALISVLWVLTLLSLIAASFTSTTRTEINLARNQADNARAEALADAGVYNAILGLSSPDSEQAWRPDGTVYAWRFARGEIRVTVWDEGGKIDLNVAPGSMLRDLFVAAGVEGDQASALADAIVDFRDRNRLRQLNGAEDRDYRLAGLPYGAKDAPFETLEELRQVMGMTAELFDRVAPALSVYSRQRLPHEPTAPPLVKAALAKEVLDDTGEDGGDAGAPPARVTPGNLPGADEASDAQEAPADTAPGPVGEPGAATRSRIRIFTIHAEGQIESGAVFAREAVVDLTLAAELPFEILSWKQARRELFEIPQPGG